MSQNTTLMEELMRKKCEEECVDFDVLTAEEREQLQKEIEANLQGKNILDGVLCNPELLYRKKF